MIDLSILITSNKDYNAFARKVVDHITSYKTDLKYEIVVCHTGDVEDDRVVSVKDTKRVGNGYAINFAFQQSRGQYFQYLSDDNIISGNVFDVFNTFESSELKGRRFQALTLQGGYSGQLTKPEPTPSFPELLNSTDTFYHLPDFNVACYPGMSRECVKRLGGYVFTPNLKYFYDWWLGAFLYLNGEPCVQCNSLAFMAMPDATDNKVIDKLTGRKETSYFGESYVNLYRLVKNYRAGDSYVYDSPTDYITEDTILEKMKKNG